MRDNGVLKAERRTRLLAQIADLEPSMHRAMGPARARCLLDVDLTMSQLKILFVIHSSIAPGGEHGLRVSEVARTLSVTLPTVTAVMDKLVERGLVRRDEDPNDRRQHVCRLTEAGHKLINDLMAGRRTYTEALLGYMSEAELAVIVQAMRLLISAAERFHAGLSPDEARGLDALPAVSA